MTNFLLALSDHINNQKVRNENCVIKIKNLIKKYKNLIKIRNQYYPPK